MNKTLPQGGLLAEIDLFFRSDPLNLFVNTSVGIVANEVVSDT